MSAGTLVTGITIAIDGNLFIKDLWNGSEKKSGYCEKGKAKTA